jgi:hypothetical protein
LYKIWKTDSALCRFPDLMAGRSERMESSVKTSAGEAVNDASGKNVGDEIDVAVHHQLLAYHKE